MIVFVWYNNFIVYYRLIVEYLDRAPMHLHVQNINDYYSIKIERSKFKFAI
jgi:hypothetical protein